MIFRFLHGWGFDASIWDAVIVQLSDFRIELLDRGYFGRPSSAVDHGANIIVTHSFGTMLALHEMPLTDCLGLIAINGFDRFTTSIDAPAVPERVVERMLTRFQQKPRVVLEEFHQRCGYEGKTGARDDDLLAQDLKALRDWDCRAETSKFAAPILSLQGGSDPILPPAMRKNLFASAPVVDRVTYPSGGHLLPLAEPLFCAERIRAFAEQLQ